MSRLNAEVNKVLAQKEAAVKLEADGAVPAGGSAAQFQAVIAREIQLWRKIVSKLGVKPE